MRYKKTILSLLILIISNSQINSQSLTEGAVNFTEYIGDFYVNASGDLAIDYVFYDDQPEVKLRWNWFQINFIEYKGVNYSAQNNQIDQSYFGYKKKDFYGDIKITERVPTIIGYSDKTKEVYAGAVNTSFTFKVDQNKWNSLSSSKKSDKKKSWKDKISPYSINLVSIKGPVIEHAFRAIKNHIAKKESKAKRIKELNFKFAALKSGFESSKKNLTVPSIRLESFNKDLAEAKSLYSSLKSLDETASYRIESFIENTLEKNISSTKREIKLKELKKKTKEAEKKRLKREDSENIFVKRAREANKSTYERNIEKVNKNFKKLESLTNNLANYYEERERKRQASIDKVKRMDAELEEYIRQRDEFFSKKKAQYQNEYNQLKTSLTNLYSNNSNILSISEAIALAYKAKLDSIYFIPVNLTAHTRDGFGTSNLRATNFSDMNFVYKNLRVNESNEKGEPRIGVTTKDNSFSTYAPIDFNSDFRTRSILVNEYTFQNRMEIEKYYAKESCEKCLGKEYNDLYFNYASLDRNSVLIGLRNQLTSREYQFLTIKDLKKVVKGLENSEQARKALLQLEEKAAKLGSMNSIYNELANGHAYITKNISFGSTNGVAKILINNGKFILFRATRGYSDAAIDSYLLYTGYKSSTFPEQIKKIKEPFQSTFGNFLTYRKYGNHGGIAFSKSYYALEKVHGSGPFEYSPSKSPRQGGDLFLRAKNPSQFGDFIVGDVVFENESIYLKPQKTVRISPGVWLKGSYMGLYVSKTNKNNSHYVYKTYNTVAGWFRDTETNRPREITYPSIYFKEAPKNLFLGKHESTFVYYDNSGQKQLVNPANNDEHFTKLFNTILNESFYYLGTRPKFVVKERKEAEANRKNEEALRVKQEDERKIKEILRLRKEAVRLRKEKEEKRIIEKKRKDSIRLYNDIEDFLVTSPLPSEEYWVKENNINEMNWQETKNFLMQFNKEKQLFQEDSTKDYYQIVGDTLIVYDYFDKKFQDGREKSSITIEKIDLKYLLRVEYDGLTNLHSVCKCASYKTTFTKKAILSDIDRSGDSNDISFTLGYFYDDSHIIPAFKHLAYLARKKRAENFKKTNPEIAREMLINGYFVRAQKSYKENKNSLSSSFLKKLMELVPTNPDIEALYIKVLYKAKRYFLVEEHINSYFKMAKQNHVDYMEIQKIAGLVKQKLLEESEHVSAKYDSYCLKRQIRQNTKKFSNMAMSLYIKPVGVTVKVKAKVSAEGKVLSARVLEGVYEEIDNEALRLVKNLSKLCITPALQRDKRVEGDLIIPIEFER